MVDKPNEFFGHGFGRATNFKHANLDNAGFVV